MNPVDALPLSLEQKIDQVCSRFEAAWKTGAQPSIEDYLADSSAAETIEIVRELILLDVFYCRQRGDVCTPADYQARFPEIASTWLAEVLNPASSAARATVDELGIVERPGGRVGPYKLLQLIGEGGMGVVFMADQTEPVRRRVALKLIKPGLDTRQVAARFEAERQALALMDHPNIAKVLEAGTIDSGRPYFVMELVRGVPIANYCDEHHLTPQQRLALFVPVCHAVQHAHQKSIIHRDLKPSNVLIALYDGEPVPKVIDFGVAKAVGGGLTDKTLFTDFGAVVGTLEYMSPEQAEPNQLDIDTRADLYALGVLLYELLTGTTPFERKRLRAAALLECLRIIREEEPQKPSTRLSSAEQMPSVAANRGLEPKKLTGLVRGDLDWIVMKCLEKDRNRRYETANGLAMDVQRYLADEPVLASPPSAAHRLRKFSRRHKTGLWVTAAALLVVVLAAGGIGWSLSDRMARETARRGELARRELETEQAVTVALAKAEQSANRAKLLPCTTSVEAKATLAEWRDAIAAVAEAEAALATGEGVEQLHERVVERRQQIETARMQSQRKEQLFRGLDDARMARATLKDPNNDSTGVAATYTAVFAAFGLEVQPGQTEVLARRIRAEEPAVREALLVGLDDWISCLSPPKDADLRALTRVADEDPWRREFRRAGVDRDGAALVRLSAEARRLTLPPASVELLATALISNDQSQEARDLLRWARGRHPADFWIAIRLGYTLWQGPAWNPVELEEQIGCYRVAVALRPNASSARYMLGTALISQGRMDDAIVEFDRAIAIDPTIPRAYNQRGVAKAYNNQWDNAIADHNKAITLNPKSGQYHLNLAQALRGKKQLDDAIVEFNKAIALGFMSAKVRNELGLALLANNQLDDAIVEFNKAVTLDPKTAVFHNNFGIALREKKQLDDAIVESNKAITLDPKNAWFHHTVAIALREKKQLDDAIVEFNKAIALGFTSVAVRNELGLALRANNQLDDAIVEFNKAVTLDPKFASAHNNLGTALAAKKQLDDAIVELNKAITLDPKIAPFHGSLGEALLQLGRFAEAKRSIQQALDLLPEKDPLLSRLLRLRDRCDALLALEPRLPDVLAGKEQPQDNRERLLFIEICRYRQRNAAGAKLSAEAFTADAKLVDDPQAIHRYNAACFSVLAAAGQGKDADKLDDKERSRLRRQALEWLRADLALWTKEANGDKPGKRVLVYTTLKDWQADTDLTSVRDFYALAKLPQAQRDAWHALWKDVAALALETRVKK